METEMHKTTMYRQGSGWIVSRWDETVKCYRLSGEMSYGLARIAVGEANCPANCGGECTGPETHQHLR